MGFYVREKHANQITFYWRVSHLRNHCFVGTFTYSDHELESDFGNADGNGYMLNAGLRSMPKDNIEFDAFIYYEDFEDDNEIGLSFSGRFYPTPQFSVGLGYDTSDDVDIISLEARLNIDLPR